MRINHSRWILSVDLASFVLLLLLSATGLLLRFGLPHGSGGGLAKGMGWRSLSRAVHNFWGLNRHEWGHLHLVIALLFLAGICLHLALHWKWIRVSLPGHRAGPLRRG